MLGGLSGWAARIPVIVAGRRGLTSYHAYQQGRLRLMASLANRIIAVHLCNSEAVRAYAIERECLRPDRTLVIPNGIDPPHGPAPDLEPSWRAPVTAAMIANFFPYKGHETALHAVRQVAAKRSGFRLVMFGDGLERGRVETLRDELGLAASIVFAGRRPDAAAYLPGFDFLLLASTQEGLPNAVMEAMACGVPPLATAVGGVPELVGHEESGLLVPPSDPDSLADAIVWMIDHPNERRRMGEAARARMERSFSTAGMVVRTEELYERLARDARPRRRPS
jgi:glycosyltransferase involved in cell wall biosynthesis